MKTASLFFLILSVFCYLFAGAAKAQISGCGASVPLYIANLTGNPDSVWVSPNHARKGYCCASSGSDNCTSFRVITDTGAVLLRMDVVSGSIPSGSLYYQVGCGTLVPMGQAVWLSGPGPFDITFCKPGNNKNVYQIGTYSKADTVITGTRSAYTCSTTAMGIGVPGGVWSSSNTSVATVDPTSGIVTGISAGTVNISYVLNTVLIKSVNVTINPTPPITGTFTVCVGGATWLSDAASSATPGCDVWSSSNTAMATVVSNSGVVSGVSVGTSNITYTMCNGCKATAVVTVTQTVPVVTGGPVCVSATTAMNNATAGGTWSSGNAGVATIAAVSGIATGVSSGTANITYTISGGCRNTGVLTVNPLPSSISGSSTVCMGSNITLTDGTSGGTWSSSSASVATIGSSSGVVTPVAAGAATVTYTTVNGCIITKIITVNNTPVMSGIGPVCVGSTLPLSANIAGGTWTSSINGRASINSSTGVVLGGSAGTSLISYQLPTGCGAAGTVTVNPLPAAISGASAVCQNSTTAMTDATLGGTWSTSSGSLASIAPSGVLTGVGTGAITVSYTLATGCGITKAMTVNGTPVINNSPVCLGATVSLSGSLAGGSWSSSNAAIATVDSVSGVATGVATGTTSITYKLATGCNDIKTITVNPQPAAISGPLSICGSSTTTLSDATAGGTWKAKNVSIATVDSLSGIVSGVSTGQVYISYVLPTGCWARSQVTVNTTPVITNTAPRVCAASTIVFTASIPGGAWSSNDVSIATIDTSGVATGVAGGNSIITYQLSNGCMDTALLAVGVLPVGISGAPVMCSGTIQTFTNSIAGGSWACGDTTVGCINSTTGVFNCTGTGITNIIYSTAAGCSASQPVTVNPVAALTGKNFMCIHLTTQLASSMSGGTWSSSITDTATISPTGLVTGIGPGTCLISYTAANGCVTAKQVKVNNFYYPLQTQPLSIPMRTNICVGNTLGMNSDLGGDGKWTTSDTTLATVTNLVPGSSAPWGVVQSLALGTVTISYTASNGCTSTHTITINPMPVITVAPATLCLYSTTTLVGIPAGGQWISHNLPAAQIGSWTGFLKGFKPEPSEIAYRLYTYDQCGYNVTVNIIPCTPKEGNSADENTHSYTIFPNPGSGIFTITQSDVVDQSMPVMVTNCLGQSVYRGNVSFVSGVGTLELPNVAPGIYMVQLDGTLEKRTVLKVAVQ